MCQAQKRLTGLTNSDRGGANGFDGWFPLHLGRIREEVAVPSLRTTSKLADCPTSSQRIFCRTATITKVRSNDTFGFAVLEDLYELFFGDTGRGLQFVESFLRCA